MKRPDSISILVHGALECDRPGADDLTISAFARLIGCRVWKAKLWLLSLGISVDLATRASQWLDYKTALFALESWRMSRILKVIPYGRTKAVACVLGLHPTTVTRYANKIGLKPIIFRRAIVRLPVHYWTRKQIKAIAAASGKLHILTTTSIFPNAGKRRVTAAMPRVGRSRRRPTQNSLAYEHDDITS